MWCQARSRWLPSTPAALQAHSGGKSLSFFTPEKTRRVEYQPEHPTSQPAGQIHCDRRAAVVPVEADARDIELVENFYCRVRPDLYTLWIARKQIGFAMAGKIERECRRAFQNERVVQ